MGLPMNIFTFRNSRFWIVEYITKEIAEIVGWGAGGGGGGGVGGGGVSLTGLDFQTSKLS